MPRKSKVISRKKALEICRHGKVGGKKLTPRAKKFMCGRGHGMVPTRLRK